MNYRILIIYDFILRLEPNIKKSQNYYINKDSLLEVQTTGPVFGSMRQSISILESDIKC